MKLRKSNYLIDSVLLLVLLLSACSLFPNLSFEDIKGEWELDSEIVFNTYHLSSIHLSILEDDESGKKWWDLGWESDDFIDWFSSSDSEDALSEFEGNVYKGHYVYWQEGEQVSHNITVTFTLSNDGRLTAEFVGDGPLDGLILEQLQKIETE
ncbi:MAG TPA: hypothetical protein PKX66_08730 [Rectinema sp.]|jgi:hypothetical protein|nr:hypothetical protein [Rectinema sp.]